jgi:hypothetical protein
MSRVESPALKGTWLGTLLRFLNPVVRLLLTSPLHWPLSRWFLLVSWAGAKTGRTHATPVSYVSDETGIFVTTGDHWPRFVVGNPTFRIRYRGGWHAATATKISDPAESAREHRHLFDQHGWFRLLAGIPSTHGHADDEAIARSIAGGRNLIRIELDSALR